MLQNFKNGYPILKHPLRRYGFALVMVLIALSIQLYLEQYIDVVNFLVVYPVIFVISWVAGFGPALMGILTSAYGVSYIFVDPKYQLIPGDLGSFLKIFIFIILSTIVIWLIDKNQESRNLLSAALNERDEFVAIASHELKTPLTSLKLHSQMLQKKLDKHLVIGPEQLGRYLIEMQKHTTRLSRLIEDMLDISRIRSGKLSIKKAPANLAEIVVEVVESFQYREEAENLLSLKIEPGLKVLGSWDVLRIEQAISNLLSNAIRYGNGKPIEVTFSVEGHQALIKVTDQGMGISEKDLARIFDRFERAAKTSSGGLGLGLFITKEIVKLHDGDVSVESQPGIGSSFTICLPIS